MQQLRKYCISSRTSLKKTAQHCPINIVDVLITVDNGRYSTAVFDKRDSFTFNIVNFPHLSLNILAYRVYISQLVRIGRICSNFVQFKHRHYNIMLTQKFMKQGFWYSGLCIAFRKFARSHVGIITKYRCSVHKTH